jgi:hypothetical protein
LPRLASFVFITYAACIVITGAAAQGFDTFSSPQQLTNQAIIAVGNIGERPRLIDNSSSTSSFSRQQQTVYEIGMFCFYRFSSLDEIAGKAGLLLVDKSSNVSIGVISNIHSLIKVKSESITLLDCASLGMQERKQIERQLEEQLEVLKRQREIFEQMRKNQQQSTKVKP